MPKEIPLFVEKVIQNPIFPLQDPINLIQYSTHKNPSNKNDAIAFISDNCVYWQVAHYCTSEQFKIK